MLQQLLHNMAPRSGRTGECSQSKRQLHGENAPRWRTVTTRLGTSNASNDVGLEGPRHGRSPMAGSGLES